MDFLQKLIDWCETNGIEKTAMFDTLLEDNELATRFKNDFEYNPIEEETVNEPIFSIEAINGRFDTLDDKLAKIVAALSLVEKIDDTPDREDVELW